GNFCRISREIQRRRFGERGESGGVRGSGNGGVFPFYFGAAGGIGASGRIVGDEGFAFCGGCDGDGKYGEQPGNGSDLPDQVSGDTDGSGFDGETGWSVL